MHDPDEIVVRLETLFSRCRLSPSRMNRLEKVLRKHGRAIDADTFSELVGLPFETSGFADRLLAVTRRFRTPQFGDFVDAISAEFISREETHERDS